MTPSTSVPPTTAGSSATTAFPAGGFRAQVSGTVHQAAADAQGKTTVSLVGQLSSGTNGTVDVELQGIAASGGGIRLQHGTVALTGSTPDDQYSGAVVGLEGNLIVANLKNPSGATIQVSLDFSQLDLATGTMAGTITGGAVPSSRTGRGSGDEG